MKIVLAQQNYHIGNFEENIRKIRDGIRDAKAAHDVADPSVGVSRVVSVSVFWRSAAAPISPPIPIESRALLGTSISAPFSFRPS